MSNDTITSLYDLTGHESGAVQYDDGAIWTGNWSSISGIPRQFLTGMLGLGEDLGDTEPIAVPKEVITAMEQHTGELREAGETILDGVEDRTGYTAVYLPAHKVTIVTHREWA